MANQIYIPYSNPATFYVVGAPAVPGKNFIHLDEDWFSTQIHSWEQEVKYFQKVQQTDVFNIQVLSEMDPLVLELIDCHGRVVKTENFTIKPTAIFRQTYRVYEATMQMADVPEGIYYLLITAGFASNTMRFISEPLDVALVHEDTLLYTYKNSINNLDVVYATGIQFHFRAETIIADYDPGSKSTVYEDQILDLVQLSATPFDQFKLKLGGSWGVPPWVAKKVNMIFCNDFVLLDGVQYVKTDGAKLEPSRAERYPMAGYTMDIRPAYNRFSGIFDPTFDDEVAVAYNIEGSVFGTMNDYPSNVQIVITERKL